MKTTFPNRSKKYQETIEQIRDIILAKGKNKISHIILFGSFARGNFVFDQYVKDNVRYSYKSDFDILVVMKKAQFKHYSNIHLEDEIKKTVSKRYLDKKSYLSLIIEPLEKVNKMLLEGQYFFSDIKKEGILLYQAEGCELAEAGEISLERRKEIAEGHFRNWFRSAESFLDNALYKASKKDYKIGAFELHQATEHFFNCSLLTLTDYKPKTHNLDILNKLCSSQSHQFLTIFPTATEEQKNCFNLLNSAYIDARYEESYTISKEQLEYLIERVEALKEITKKVCEEKIESFVWGFVGAEFILVLNTWIAAISY